MPSYHIGARLILLSAGEDEIFVKPKFSAQLRRLSTRLIPFSFVFCFRGRRTTFELNLESSKSFSLNNLGVDEIELRF